MAHSACTLERIAVIERALEDARHLRKPKHPWPVYPHASRWGSGLLRDILGNICGAYDAMLEDAACLERLCSIVASARVQAPGPSPELDILEHALHVPLRSVANSACEQSELGLKAQDDPVVAGMRLVAVADIALALFRLSESARE